MDKCPECNGTGEIEIPAETDDGAAEIVECEVCGGTGEWNTGENQ